MVHALQHTQATLVVQPSSPRYLRSTHISYTDQSSIANPRRVHFPGVGPHLDHFDTKLAAIASIMHAIQALAASGAIELEGACVVPTSLYVSELHWE